MSKFIELRVNSTSRLVSIRPDKVVAVMDSLGVGCIVCLEQYDSDSIIETIESREAVVKRIEDALNQ